MRGAMADPRIPWAHDGTLLHFAAGADGPASSTVAVRASLGGRRAEAAAARLARIALFQSEQCESGTGPRLLATLDEDFDAGLPPLDACHPFRVMRSLLLRVRGWSPGTPTFRSAPGGFAALRAAVPV